MVDRRTGRLCWVDIVQGMIYEHDPADGRQVTAAKLDTMVGAIAPRAHVDGYAVAVAGGFGYWTSGRLTITDPVLPEAHRRMNDAKCDSRGRLWAGSTHMEFVPGVGALHLWDGTSPSVPIVDGLTLPNGLGWDHADTTMYLIDSMTNSLLSAAYHADDGLLDEFATVCRIEPGLPDWPRGRRRRFDLDRGLGRGRSTPLQRQRRADRDRSDARHPAVQLRFRARGTFYFTTVRAGLSRDELADQPHAGSVFALVTKTRGVPVSAFAH